MHEVARIREGDGMSDSPIVKEWARLASLMSSKTAEHLTPSWVLDLVEKVAPIGLDPCGHGLAESSRRATMTYYQTLPQTPDYQKLGWLVRNGLEQSWSAELAAQDAKRLVFVNPPYGRELKAWAAKMAAERDCAIIALVPARVDTAWWRELDPLAWCALAGRVKFLDSEGNEQDAAPFPSAVCLLHSTQLLSKFVEVFQERGPVYVRVHE